MAKTKSKKGSVLIMATVGTVALGIVGIKSGVVDDLMGSDKKRVGKSNVQKVAPPPKLSVPKQSNVEIAAKVIENAQNKGESVQHISLVYTVRNQELIAKSTKLQAQIAQSETQIEKAKLERFMIEKEKAKASGNASIPVLEETEANYPGLVPQQQNNHMVSTMPNGMTRDVMSGIVFRGIYKNKSGKYIATVKTLEGLFEFKQGDVFGDNIVVEKIDSRKMVLSHKESETIKPFYINLRG
jgi:hypothetical protein